VADEAFKCDVRDLVVSLSKFYLFPRGNLTHDKYIDLSLRLQCRYRRGAE
jgi:hypothetical protein